MRRRAAALRAAPESPPAKKRGRHELRTENARRAVQLSSLYASLVRDQALAGFQPELGSPSGNSTDGGAMAKQPLSLVRGAERIAFGYVDVAEKRCRLKTFELLEVTHRRRFEEALPFDRAAYAKLFVTTADLARKRGLDVDLEEPPPEADASPSTLDATERPPRSSLRVLVVSLLLVVALALVVVAV